MQTNLTVILCAALSFSSAFATTPPRPAEALAVETLPAAADALDACAGGGDLHVAYLEGPRAFHAVKRAGAGAFEKATELPVKPFVGKWGGTIRLAVAGGRVLVLVPAEDGFTLAASADGGRTWSGRPSREITGHEAVESQRIVAAGDAVHLVWVNEHAKAAAGDKVAKPIHLASSADGGRTFGAPRAITDGFPAACPCCVPAVSASGAELLVAYRTSIRNVKEVGLLISRDGGRSFTFRSVSDDRWTMMGCPANGPGLAVAGDRVGVTWTREKTILRAVSSDGGRTFAKPQPIGHGTRHLAAGARGQIVVVNETERIPSFHRDGLAGPLHTPLAKVAALVELPGTGAVLVTAKAK